MLGRMDTLELSEAQVVEPVAAEELVRALPDNLALSFLSRFRQDEGAFFRTADGRVLFQPHDGGPERPAPVRLHRIDQRA
jgi:hypothetical protein